MSTHRVLCRFTRAPIRLRELTGSDEQWVTGVDTGTAIDLLDRLIVRPAPGEQANGSPGAASLTVSDRDRLLAAVYRMTFGERIQSTAVCARCGQPFDLEFSMEQLVGVLDRAGETTADGEPDAEIRLASGVRLRLPTGADELAILGLPHDEAERELLRRCLVEGSNDVTPEVIEQRITEAAPVLDLDLDAACPECGHEQQVHFDLQFYLLRAIEQERRLLAREVHLLATAYGWSLHEILGLPRSQRRIFVELIESDNEPKHEVIA